MVQPTISVSCQHTPNSSSGKFVHTEAVLPSQMDSADSQL